MTNRQVLQFLQEVTHRGDFQADAIVVDEVLDREVTPGSGWNGEGYHAKVGLATNSHLVVRITDDHDDPETEKRFIFTSWAPSDYREIPPEDWAIL